MKTLKLAVALLLGSIAGAPAFADPTTAQTVETQRDVNQQQRIESGLQSGQLTTHEAGRLEQDEAHIDRMEAHAAADGAVTKAEAARINAAQNKVSSNIYDEKHDVQVGSPNSASSQRMQQDVQRNVNQEKRINRGVKSGQLTTREAGHLQRGQAHVAHAEANAAAHGGVSRAESTHVNRVENRQSNRISAQKHDDQTKQTN
jgi:hypothetical protein